LDIPYSNFLSPKSNHCPILIKLGIVCLKSPKPFYLNNKSDANKLEGGSLQIAFIQIYSSTSFLIVVKIGKFMDL
jgi:hypothetical protein